MHPKPKRSYSERGQAIVIIAGALIGIIAIIGLMIDVGILFIDSSRLKRSVDAAAVSAALQYREGYTDDGLEKAATDFIQLNEGNATDVVVEVCNPFSALHQPELCPPVTTPPTPPKKTVRVSASKFVEFGFLPVIGIRGTTIRTNAIGEAASIDVVLVIDASESMAYETDASKLDPAAYANEAAYLADYELLASSDYPDDTSECNLADDCEPFRSIKNVAKDFIDTLYFPYDRVAVVTFDRFAHYYPAPPSGLDYAPWIMDTDGDGIAKDEVLEIIDNLKVFEPPDCRSVDATIPGPCLRYDAANNFDYMDCLFFRVSDSKDPTSCTSSNIGGGLALAGNTFALALPMREDSLWAVILLAGGPANATDPFLPGLPYGACPQYSTPAEQNDAPYCRDDDASVRHTLSPNPADPPPPFYDGDDYARDMADFITDPVDGQGAIIYAIGLGDKVKNDLTRYPGGDPDIGEQFLQYAATAAGGTEDIGVYYYAPNTAELEQVFQAIAQNIATKITH